MLYPFHAGISSGQPIYVAPALRNRYSLVSNVSDKAYAFLDALKQDHHIHDADHKDTATSKNAVSAIDETLKMFSTIF